MASAGSLFQVDQLSPPAGGGPVGKGLSGQGKQRGQDANTESTPEEGMLEMKQRAQGAPFPPVHVGPSDSPESPGPRAGKSLTPNSKEGTGAHSASPSLFAKLFSLSRGCDRGWEWRVNVTLTFIPSLKTHQEYPGRSSYGTQSPDTALAAPGTWRRHSALCDSVFPVVKQKREWLTGYPRTKASLCFDLCRPLPGGGAGGPSKPLRES